MKNPSCSRLGISLSQLYIGVFVFISLNLHAQVWQSYVPLLPDTLGTYDLRIAHNNEQVAWSVLMKYDVTSSSYNWVPSETLFFAKTSDGGSTWSGGVIPMGVEPYASNICPINDNIAWASAVDVDFKSYVLRTIDGGTTWESFLEDAFTDPSGYVDFVHFWDEQNGIVMGDPTPSENDPIPFYEIYRTSDGGSSWQRIPSANIPAANGEFGIAGDYEVHGDHVWFSSADASTFFPRRIFHSKDRGLTWEVLDPGDRFVFFSFADSLHGITAIRQVANSPDVTINYTDDGGQSWTELPTYNSPEPAIDYILIPESHFILMSKRVDNINGPFLTYLSKDLGQSWQEISNGEFIANMDFSSPTVGYAGEWQPVDHPTRMYKYIGSPLTGLLSGKSLEAEVKITPNPTTNWLQVQVISDKPAPCLLLLNDMQGKLLERQLLDESAQGQAQFDMSDLPAGIYTLTISQSGGFLSRKIVRN
ncbi:MAG TPA: T9SS type A sorting domain-containing protein [Saprospiraceae bacterium]|nr:T9SS type A sorting domain-containing protein [Saprospiraceae bacterium]HMQ84355.1 T9SS type A sorting domain-containing protein [Saprospiraceae bacterium]